MHSLPGPDGAWKPAIRRQRYALNTPDWRLRRRLSQQKSAHVPHHAHSRRIVVQWAARRRPASTELDELSMCSALRVAVTVAKNSTRIAHGPIGPPAAGVFPVDHAARALRPRHV